MHDTSQKTGMSEQDKIWLRNNIKVSLTNPRGDALFICMSQLYLLIYRCFQGFIDHEIDQLFTAHNSFLEEQITNIKKEFMHLYAINRIAGFTEIWKRCKSSICILRTAWKNATQSRPIYPYNGRIFTAILGEQIFRRVMRDELSEIGDEAIAVMCQARANHNDHSARQDITEFLASTLGLFSFDLIHRAFDSANDFYKAQIAVFVLEHNSEYTIEYIRFAKDSAAHEKSLYSPQIAEGCFGVHTEEDKKLWITQLDTKIVRIFVEGHENGLSHVISTALLKKDYVAVRETLVFLESVEDLRPKIIGVAIRAFVITSATPALTCENWLERVANLVDAHETTRDVLKQCFNDVPYYMSYNSTWRHFLCNLGPEVSVRVGEYCSFLINDDQSPGKFERVTQLVPVLPDSDIFFDAYKSGLAKRLLTHGPASQLEITALGYLRVACGQMAMYGTDGMVKDSTLWSEFKNDASIKFCPLVCTLSAWPRLSSFQSGQSIDWIPANMCKLMADYEIHYRSLHTSRKLNWMPAASTCVVSAEFKRGSKMIQCSLRQAVTLLEFNDKDSISRKLDQDEMTLANSHLLIGDSDTHYTLNHEFASPHINVRLLKTPRASSKPHTQISQTLLRERIAITQACIVRLLKARKNYTHPQLVIDVLAGTVHQFQADNYFVKKQIEELIEQRYIERDAKDLKLYHYIA